MIHNQNTGSKLDLFALEFLFHRAFFSVNETGSIPDTVATPVQNVAALNAFTGYQAVCLATAQNQAVESREQ